MSKRKAIIMVAAILGLAALLYIGGLLGQLLADYREWLAQDGLTGNARLPPVDWNPITCFSSAFTFSGLQGVGLVLLVIGGLLVY